MAYYVYILTNKNKSVFYTGFTNNLKRERRRSIEGSISIRMYRKGDISHES